MMGEPVSPETTTPLCNKTHIKAAQWGIMKTLFLAFVFGTLGIFIIPTAFLCAISVSLFRLTYRTTQQQFELDLFEKL